MKLEVNISKGNMFVFLGAIIIISSIFIAYATITDSNAPNHPGDQIRVSSGDYMDDSVDQAIDKLDSRLDNLENFSAGDTVVVTSDKMEEVTVRDVYTTCKTFTTGQAGTVRLEFQYRPSYQGYDVITRVVRKRDGSTDTVWGPTSKYKGSSWKDSGAIDLDVQAGDIFYIQGYADDLYFSGDNYFGAAQIRNAKIKLSNELPQITFD